MECGTAGAAVGVGAGVGVGLLVGVGLSVGAGAGVEPSVGAGVGVGLSVSFGVEDGLEATAPPQPAAQSNAIKAVRKRREVVLYIQITCLKTMSHASDPEFGRSRRNHK